jgi:hypothetical protein
MISELLKYLKEKAQWAMVKEASLIPPVIP